MLGVASGQPRVVFPILGHTPSYLGRRLFWDTNAISLETRNVIEMVHHCSTDWFIVVLIAAPCCRQNARKRWRLPDSNLGHLVYCENGCRIRRTALKTSRGLLRSLLLVVLPRLAGRSTSRRKNVDMWRVRYLSHY